MAGNRLFGGPSKIHLSAAIHSSPFVRTRLRSLRAVTLFAQQKEHAAPALRSLQAGACSRDSIQAAMILVMELAA
jgi:hypothetical protein